jgi:hypothetical protein
MWILKKKYDYWWKKYGLSRLTGRLKLCFLTEIGRLHWNQGEEVIKIWIDFRKSPRFSLTSPSSQEREKSSRPVFTMCGEPCYTRVYQVVKRQWTLKIWLVRFRFMVFSTTFNNISVISWLSAVLVEF